MKRFLSIWAFTSTVLFGHNLAYAGSPGGLILVVTSTVAAEPYMRRIRDFVERYDTPNGVHSCNGDQLNIESVVFTPDQRKINSDIVLAAASHPSQRKQFEGVLSKYRDKAHLQGLDGALSIARVGDALILRGISAAADEPVHTISLLLVNADDPSKLDAAICKVIVDLPVMRAP